MQGVNAFGQSKRAEAQARRMFRNTGNYYSTEIRKAFSTKAQARDYEPAVIERFRKMFGESKLPGNKGNR